MIGMRESVFIAKVKIPWRDELEDEPCEEAEYLNIYDDHIEMETWAPERQDDGSFNRFFRERRRYFYYDDLILMNETLRKIGKGI